MLWRCLLQDDVKKNADQAFFRYIATRDARAEKELHC